MVDGGKERPKMIMVGLRGDVIVLTDTTRRLVIEIPRAEATRIASEIAYLKMEALGK